MLKLAYTIEEMKSALQRIGYEVKFEEEVETVKDYHSFKEVPRKVWNCYYKGDRINMWDYLYGTRRLENVFEQELRKRVLGLF